MKKLFAAGWLLGLMLVFASCSDKEGVSNVDKAEVIKNVKQELDTERDAAQITTEQSEEAPVRPVGMMADIGTEVGQIAPEIALPGPDGKTVKLSDLRGKYVVVDFWASWCGPCRRENPHMVRVYDQFKDKGFEILGVSLDKKKDRWVGAIKQENLTWQHASELKFWNSQAARLYGVNAIPATFLLDKNGRIVAKNLRSAALEARLQSLL